MYWWHAIDITKKEEKPTLSPQREIGYDIN